MLASTLASSVVVMSNKKNTFSEITYKYVCYSALGSQMAPDGLSDSSAAWK